MGGASTGGLLGTGPAAAAFDLKICFGLGLRHQSPNPRPTCDPYAGSRLALPPPLTITHLLPKAKSSHLNSAPWYPKLVASLLRDLPELLAFFACPRPLRRRLQTTNIIERGFVEVRRRTRPMVCLVTVQSVERIIYSIFNRFNLEWRQHTLRQFT